MDNVLIDDRRIHVDFSQSVAKVKFQKQGIKALFTMEGGLLSSVIFPGFVYMSGRVTLLGGLTFLYHVKGQGRVTLLRGLSFQLSDLCRIHPIYKHGFTWSCLLVEVALGTTLHM